MVCEKTHGFLFFVSVPNNFAANLERYTQQGYRVIALGHRRLPKLNYAKVRDVSYLSQSSFLLQPL